jgi:hypothetical protein
MMTTGSWASAFAPPAIRKRINLDLGDTEDDFPPEFLPEAYIFYFSIPRNVPARFKTASISWTVIRAGS